jgi:class 3 adenylate cyclase
MPMPWTGNARCLRKAWAEHGGVELGTEGDSFYVVFATAPDAVAAAHRHNASWPGSTGRRVSGCECGWVCTPCTDTT